MNIVSKSIALLFLFSCAILPAQKMSYSNVNSFSTAGVAAIRDYSGSVKGYYLIFGLEPISLVKPKEIPHRIELLDTLLNSIGGVDLMKDENYHILSVISTEENFVFLLSHFESDKLDKMEMELLSIDRKTLKSKSLAITPNEIEIHEIYKPRYYGKFAKYIDETYLKSIGDGFILKRKGNEKKSQKIVLSCYNQDLSLRWTSEYLRPITAHFNFIGEENGVIHYYVNNYENQGSMLKPKVKVSSELLGIDLKSGTVRYSRGIGPFTNGIYWCLPYLEKGTGIVVNISLVNKETNENPEGIAFGDLYFDFNGNKLDSNFVFLDNIKGINAAALKEGIKKMTYNVLTNNESGNRFICVDRPQNGAYDLQIFSMDSTKTIIKYFEVLRVGSLFDLPDATDMNNRGVAITSGCDYKVATNRSKAEVNLQVMIEEMENSYVHKWASITIGENMKRRDFTAGSKDYPSHIIQLDFERYLIVDFIKQEKLLKLELVNTNQN
jgi:hypothetical protein